MKRKRGAEFDDDARHLLYREYLKIVASHAPPIFVMENVKGLLSSQHQGGPIFERILHDLSMPRVAIGGRDRGLRYRLLGLGPPASSREFVVRSETLGIPQARHRVIVVGVREDLAQSVVIAPIGNARPTPLSDVIGDLPPVRSGVSHEDDTHAGWVAALAEGAAKLRTSSSVNGIIGLVDRIERALEGAKAVETRGEAFVPYSGSPGSYSKWYFDSDLGGVTGHRSRRHMRSDLWRYLYAAAFTDVVGRSPSLRDFPRNIRPAHKNADSDDPIFADRFRVQLASRPASTVTSHLSKDGNYFIHYDPSQSRSFTVREAARVQTFPDNYVFLGGATHQYAQIGNAVPPLLARHLAELVARAIA